MDAKHILNNGREVENIMAFHVIHYWVSLLDGKTAKRAPAFSSILFHTCHNSSINSLKRAFPLADRWLRMLPASSQALPAEGRGWAQGAPMGTPIQPLNGSDDGSTGRAGWVGTKVRRLLSWQS